jgi:hypothetical protein
MNTHKMCNQVVLTPDELYQAVIVGARRRIICIFRRKNKQHYESPRSDEWATEIESCCAEMALAKHLGVYWTGGAFEGERAAHDVGVNKQVRHTTYPNGSLIIYPEDKPEDRFVLVTGKAPNYLVIGWCFGRDAHEKGKDHPWWTQPQNKLSPSWWVPQLELRPMNTVDDPIRKPVEQSTEEWLMDYEE